MSTNKFDVIKKMLEVQASMVKMMENEPVEQGSGPARQSDPRVITIIERMQGDAIIRNAPSGDEIHAENSVVITRGSTATGITLQITAAFEKARSLTETADIDTKKKEEIKEKLACLEVELKKEDQDPGTAYKCWNWLKRNAPTILTAVPELARVVQEVMKTIFG